MPSTSIYAIPYPAGTDAPNGPLQMQNLAQAVENAMQGPAALVENSVAQAAATATDTPLTFNTALWNAPSSVWSAGSPTRLTMPGTGSQLWAFFAQVANSFGNGTSSRELWFRIGGSGTQHYWKTREQPGTTVDPYLSTSGLLVVSGGSYVEAIFTHQAGITLNTVAGKVRFGGVRLR